MLKSIWVYSSSVECFLDMEEVVGSTPTRPTKVYGPVSHRHLPIMGSVLTREKTSGPPN